MLAYARPRPKGAGKVMRASSAGVFTKNCGNTSKGGTKGVVSVSG